MKNFFERNPMLMIGVAICSVMIAVMLGILLVGAKELQEEALNRIDKVAADDDLPGPKNNISWRSRRQVDILLGETPHVIGGWVTKLSYTEHEYPIIHVWAGDSVVTETLNGLAEQQAGPNGTSSAALSADPQIKIRNSEEAKTGLIKCGPLSQTTLLRYNPRAGEKIKGLCRATLPPFDEGGNLAIIVALNVDGEGNGPEIQEIRKTLLRLQIDISNRDYQGRETWARSVR